MLDDELKEAWLANIPAVIIEEEKTKLLLDRTTKQGVYNRVMVMTGDAALAERLSNDFAVQQKLAAAVATQGTQQ